MEKLDLRTEFEVETEKKFNIELYNDYVDWLEQKIVENLDISAVCNGMRVAAWFFTDYKH